MKMFELFKPNRLAFMSGPEGGRDESPSAKDEKESGAEAKNKQEEIKRELTEAEIRARLEAAKKIFLEEKPDWKVANETFKRVVNDKLIAEFLDTQLVMAAMSDPEHKFKFTLKDAVELWEQRAHDLLEKERVALRSQENEKASKEREQYVKKEVVMLLNPDGFPQIKICGVTVDLPLGTDHRILAKLIQFAKENLISALQKADKTEFSYEEAKAFTDEFGDEIREFIVEKENSFESLREQTRQQLGFNKMNAKSVEAASQRIPDKLEFVMRFASSDYDAKVMEIYDATMAILENEFLHRLDVKKYMKNGTVIPQSMKDMVGHSVMEAVGGKPVKKENGTQSDIDEYSKGLKEWQSRIDAFQNQKHTIQLQSPEGDTVAQVLKDYVAANSDDPKEGEETRKKELLAASQNWDFEKAEHVDDVEEIKKELAIKMAEKGYEKDAKVVVTSNKNEKGIEIKIVINGDEFGGQSENGNTAAAWEDALNKITDIDQIEQRLRKKIIETSGSWDFSKVQFLNKPELKDQLARKMAIKRFNETTKVVVDSEIVTEKDKKFVQVKIKLNNREFFGKVEMKDQSAQNGTEAEIEEAFKNALVSKNLEPTLGGVVAGGDAVRRARELDKQNKGGEGAVETSGSAQGGGDTGGGSIEAGGTVSGAVASVPAGKEPGSEKETKKQNIKLRMEGGIKELLEDQKTALVKVLDQKGYNGNVNVSVRAEEGRSGYMTHITINGKEFLGISAQDQSAAYSNALKRIEENKLTSDAELKMNEILTSGSLNFTNAKDLDNPVFKEQLARKLAEEGYGKESKVSLVYSEDLFGKSVVKIVVDGAEFTGTHRSEKGKAFTYAMKKIDKSTAFTEENKTTFEAILAASGGWSFENSEELKREDLVQKLARKIIEKGMGASTTVSIKTERVWNEDKTSQSYRVTIGLSDNGRKEEYVGLNKDDDKVAAFDKALKSKNQNDEDKETEDILTKKGYAKIEFTQEDYSKIVEMINKFRKEKPLSVEDLQRVTIGVSKDGKVIGEPKFKGDDSESVNIISVLLTRYCQSGTVQGMDSFKAALEKAKTISSPAVDTAGAQPESTANPEVTTASAAAKQSAEKPQEKKYVKIELTEGEYKKITEFLNTGKTENLFTEDDVKKMSIAVSKDNELALSYKGSDDKKVVEAFNNRQKDDGVDTLAMYIQSTDGFKKSVKESGFEGNVVNVLGDIKPRPTQAQLQTVEVKSEGEKVQEPVKNTVSRSTPELIFGASGNWEFKGLKALDNPDAKMTLATKMAEKGYDTLTNVSVVSEKIGDRVYVTVTLDGRSFAKSNKNEYQAFADVIDSIRQDSLGIEGKTRYDEILKTSESWDFKEAKNLNNKEVKEIIARKMLEQGYEKDTKVSIYAVEKDGIHSVKISLNGEQYSTAAKTLKDAFSNALKKVEKNEVTPEVRVKMDAILGSENFKEGTKGLTEKQQTSLAKVMALKGYDAEAKVTAIVKDEGEGCMAEITINGCIYRLHDEGHSKDATFKKILEKITTVDQNQKEGEILAKADKWVFKGEITSELFDEGDFKEMLARIMAVKGYNDDTPVTVEMVTGNIDGDTSYEVTITLKDRSYKGYGVSIDNAIADSLDGIRKTKVVKVPKKTVRPTVDEPEAGQQRQEQQVRAPEQVAAAQQPAPAPTPSPEVKEGTDKAPAVTEPEANEEVASTKMQIKFHDSYNEEARQAITEYIESEKESIQMVRESLAKEKDFNKFQELTAKVEAIIQRMERSLAGQIESVAAGKFKLSQITSGTATPETVRQLNRDNANDIVAMQKRTLEPPAGDGRGGLTEGGRARIGNKANDSFDRLDSELDAND